MARSMQRDSLMTTEAAQAEPSSADTGANPGASTGASTSRRTRRMAGKIGIADDSSEMRWLIRSVVESDFDEIEEIVEVADGRQLLWELLRSSFTSRSADRTHAVVVADLAMPAYSGLDIIDVWRDLNPTTPTILITAFPSEAVRERASRLGAVVLAKPFSTSALRHVIREAVGERAR
jgi:CheY-like chemotaxis protein